MKAQTISIIGLDRTGTSLGLALKQSPLDLVVVGHDPDSNRSRAAQALGAIDKSARNLGKAAAQADILVLAIPFSELKETLLGISNSVRNHTVIIDLSDLKEPGIIWAQKFQLEGHYVGARLVMAAPSLSDGRNATELADAALFQNSLYCVIPDAKADPAAVETAVNFGRLIGAKPYFLSPKEHDVLVQGTETMPGLMAASLFSAVHKTIAWRDMLRFADLPFALTTLPLQNSDDIVHLALNDKEATLRWLNAVITEMQEIRQWVYEGDADLLTARLEEMMFQREKWLRERTRNEWLEDTGSTYKQTFSEHLFGGLANLRGPDDKS